MRKENNSTAARKQYENDYVMLGFLCIVVEVFFIVNFCKHKAQI